MRSRAAKSRNHVEKAVEEEEDGEGPTAPAAYTAGSGGRRIAPAVAVVPKFASVAVRASERPRCFPLCGAAVLRRQERAPAASKWSRRTHAPTSGGARARDRSGPHRQQRMTERHPTDQPTNKQTNKQTGKCAENKTMQTRKRRGATRREQIKRRPFCTPLRPLKIHTKEEKKEGDALSARPPCRPYAIAKKNIHQRLDVCTATMDAAQ